MIDERTVSYVRSLIEDPGEVLCDIAEEARAEYVPIIRPETGDVLKVLLQIKKPVHILEIGTAVGYSAIYMGTVTDASCHITTIENYAPRVIQARKNIDRAGMQERICLLEGDAMDVLPELSEQYDFVFMDAAKGQYIHFLEPVYRLMRPGAILVTDNVLQDGEILESHFTVPKRNRTIHDRMREYLYALKHYEGLSTAVLTVGDGLAVSVKCDGWKGIE